MMRALLCKTVDSAAGYLGLLEPDLHTWHYDTGGGVPFCMMQRITLYESSNCKFVPLCRPHSTHKLDSRLRYRHKQCVMPRLQNLR